MGLRTRENPVRPARIVKLKAPLKVADPELLTSDHRAWRRTVLERAGYQCEHINARGERCPRSEALGFRIVADHIVERADGGALYDPDNGQALCVGHNTAKGLAARADRRKG